jgi:hypothetical protein
MRGPAANERGPGPRQVREQPRVIRMEAPLRQARGNGEGRSREDGDVARVQRDDSRGRERDNREFLRAQRDESRGRGRDDRLDRAEIRGNGNRAVVDQVRLDDRRRGRGLIEGCPPGLAKKNNGCLPPGLAAKSGNGAALTRAGVVGAAGVTAASLLAANTFTPSWFGYDDYGPDYRYYDGYLLRTNGDNVLGYVPLLGGALSVGSPWQTYYQPEPIVPYWADYYDLEGLDRYRYYDDVLYEVDPGDSQIEEIVALMAGDPWAVGRPMPIGYDVYNVPYAYRERYYDSDDHWYRYSDGYVYDIDPTTRLVSAIIQLIA